MSNSSLARFSPCRWLLTDPETYKGWMLKVYRDTLSQPGLELWAWSVELQSPSGRVFRYESAEFEFADFGQAANWGKHQADLLMNLSEENWEGIPN